MQEQKIHMPVPEMKPIPKVFRQNIMRICIFATLFQPLYFPVFVYNRRKALKEGGFLPRYLFHILLPIIGVSINMVMFGLFYLFTVQSLIPEQRTFANIMAIVESDHSVWFIASQISLIVALLCFVIVIIDMTASMSEVLKRLKVRFPQYLHNAPYIFAGVSFLYTLSEVMLIQGASDQAMVFVVMMQILFVISLILVHMYITNVYMLMRALQIKKES